MTEKTEKPTPRRQRKARQQGDSPISAPAGQALGFVVAIALVPAAVAATAERSGQLFAQALRPEPVPFQPGLLAWDVVSLAAPMLAAAAVAVFAAGFVQTGGVLSAARLGPKLERLNPFAGAKNLWSLQRLTTLLRTLFAAGVVTWLALDILSDHTASLCHSVGQPELAPALASALVGKLAWGAATVGVGLAGLDIFVSQRAWLRRHRMSLDEIKREHRESEGDPELKAARKRAHQEVLNEATVSAVKNASVLIINPTHIAMALRYREEEDEAPRLVGHGEGDLARRMVQEAERWGIPVVQDVPLAHALKRLDVGDEIPEALYEAVAEVLREIWESEHDAPSGDDAPLLRA